MDGSVQYKYISCSSHPVPKFQVNPLTLSFGWLALLAAGISLGATGATMILRKIQS